MLTMAQTNRIRNEYFINGNSISEIARMTGHDRKTIRRIVNRTDYRVKDTPPKPPKSHCIDPFLSTIQTWLEENSHQWHKNRLTATRIHALLQEKFPTTYRCSYRTVANTVKEIRTTLMASRSAYIPLMHPPGEAQGDFGTTYYYDASHSPCKGSFFSLVYPYSNAGFTQLFRGETLECFLQAMHNIFHYTQSVPTRIWFDNASPLVKTILKEGKRVIADRFYRFANHYGFTPVFCNPHSPHEKGAVENKVGYHRRNLFTPYLEVTSLQATNTTLLARCTEDNRKKHYVKKTPIDTLFQDDVKKSLPVPDKAFVVENRLQLQTDKYGKIRLGKGPKIYSVGPMYAVTKVWVCVGADTVRILDTEYHEICTHPRLFGSTCEESVQWQQYLPLVMKKPRSLPYTGLWSQLGDSLQAAFKSASYQDQKQLLAVLQNTTQEVGFPTAVQALTQAVEQGHWEKEAVRMLARICKDDPLPPIQSLPSSVPTTPVQSIHFDAYDALLSIPETDTSEESLV